MQLCYRAFSLTWLAAMQFTVIKGSFCIWKVNLAQDWFEIPTWPSFYCFGTTIWWKCHHVKRLYRYLLHEYIKFEPCQHYTPFRIIFFFLLGHSPPTLRAEALRCYEISREEEGSFLFPTYLGRSKGLCSQVTHPQDCLTFDKCLCFTPVTSPIQFKSKCKTHLSTILTSLLEGHLQMKWGRNWINGRTTGGSSELFEAWWCH